MAETGLKHTMWQGPWHFCARCDDKCKIANMTWQRGLLLCNENCVDKMLTGEREIGIALVLSDGKEELVPVEKLRNPTDFQEIDEIMF